MEGQGQRKGTAWWPWAVSWVALSGPLIPPSRSPCFIHHKSYFNWKGEEMICLLVRACWCKVRGSHPRILELFSSGACNGRSCRDWLALRPGITRWEENLGGCITTCFVTLCLGKAHSSFWRADCALICMGCWLWCSLPTTGSNPCGTRRISTLRAQEQQRSSLPLLGAHCTIHVSLPHLLSPNARDCP